MSYKSRLEEQFWVALEEATLTSGCEREHQFCPPRRWRFDFSWPSLAVAVEIEGGTFIAGRHTSGAGFVADAEKYATATLLGWRVLRVPGSWLRAERDGECEAVRWTRALLAQSQYVNPDTQHGDGPIRAGAKVSYD